MSKVRTLTIACHRLMTSSHSSLIRIVLAADPVVLFVARKRHLGSLLCLNEPLMVVCGRIDEVSDNLLWRPLPGGARAIRLAI